MPIMIIESANVELENPSTRSRYSATDTTSAECDDGMPPAPVMRSGLKVFCFIANSAVLIICAEINDISPTVTVGFAIKIFI